MTELEAVQRRMVADRTALQEGNAVAGMPASIVATQGNYGIDLREEEVVIDVGQPSDQLEADFEQFYAVPVELRSSVAGPD